MCEYVILRAYVVLRVRMRSCGYVCVYVHAPHEEGDWAPGAASNAWRARSLVPMLSRTRSLTCPTAAALIVVCGPVTPGKIVKQMQRFLLPLLRGVVARL